MPPPGALVPTVGTGGRSGELRQVMGRVIGLDPRRMGSLSAEDVRAMNQRAAMSDQQVAFAEKWNADARRVMDNTTKVERMVAAFFKAGSKSVQAIAKEFAATNEEAVLLEQKIAQIQALSDTKIAGIEAETDGFVQHQQVLKESNLQTIAYKWRLKQEAVGRNASIDRNAAASQVEIDADMAAMRSYLNGGDFNGRKFNPAQAGLATASSSTPGWKPRWGRSRSTW